MDFFIHFTLPITIIMALLLILCLGLSIKFSRQLKSLRYASIISFLMVFGVLIIFSFLGDYMGEIAGICFMLFLCPGFFLALPIMCILDVPIGGPCAEAEPFYYAFVGSFIFYVLLILWIIKLRQIFRDRGLQKKR
jgi:hypothetical protein